MREFIEAGLSENQKEGTEKENTKEGGGREKAFQSCHSLGTGGDYVCQGNGDEKCGGSPLLHHRRPRQRNLSVFSL
ncbi:hypothetical protein PVAP13_1KG484905 [Panicum virgatum]|uniref:Uncharacterized protein n=1 Tax=Panicum virgatum TaxID=38727 RepID=A0A8T0Y151_PANVG|nr:hypothetical protein PVAP13_1KG484905 [Panicum virgatum]